MNSANGIFQEFCRDYKQLVLTFQNSKTSYIPEHILLTPPKESLDQTETILLISRTLKTIRKVQDKFLWQSFFNTSLVKVYVFNKSSLKAYLY